MTNRTKVTLRAPDGVTESIIEGTYYWPDENGEVQTTNAAHRAILERHGYTFESEVSIMQPAAVRGAIEVDELGRGQLAQALNDRGLSFPENATRPELAEIAEAWNAARRRGRGAPEEQQTKIRAADASQTSAGTQQPETTGERTGAGSGAADEVNFDNATYDELKGWLAGHGVAFPPNSPKKKLKEMAEVAYAELTKAARAKAAVA